MLPILLSYTCFLAGSTFASITASCSLVNETVSTGCYQACAELATAFGPFLHYPDTDNFTIWDAKQQEVRPACRVEPSNATDVAQILSILIDNWCYFAVKGGGHSRHPGDSNAIAGVTIDLNRINTIEVAVNGKTAHVGGGATSAQVYQSLEPRNLSFVGGRVGQVGIGGFTLGGGTYPFANKYGWALDNVYKYEVVLANSTITTASEDYNPDLYFALRGGGNNFGIVTNFTIRVFPQGPIYNAMTTYSEEQTEEVLDRVYDLFTDSYLSSDVEMGYDLYYTYSSANDRFVMMGTQRYETPMMNPPVFEAINQIPTLRRTAVNASLANLTGGSAELGTTRHLFDTLSVLPSRALLSQGIEIFKQEVEAIKSVDGLTPNFICYPAPRNAIAAMKRRGGNALGIDQDEPLFLILISTGWSNATDDAAVTTMTTNTVERTRAAAHALGVAHPYIYINYASAGRSNQVFASYGEQNAQRLKDIQKAVDPNGIFTEEGLWRGFMKLL